MGCPKSKVWGPSFGKTWGSTAILPGKFAGTKVAPVEGAMQDYPYSWVTVGGADTSSGGWQKTAEQDIINSNAKGCAFDEEGGVSARVAGPWIKSMRAKHPDWTFVYIPQCGTSILPYNATGGCDYIAPMMYYSNGDSYPNMDFTTGKGQSVGCLAQMQKQGWPAAKTILTFQSFDAFRLGGNTTHFPNGVAKSIGRNSNNQNQSQSLGHVLSGSECQGCIKGNSEGEGLLMTLGKLLTNNFKVTLGGQYDQCVLKGPFAGAIGWPSQCGGPGRKCWPDMDRHNLKILLKAAGMPGGGEQ
jgi:hypothetical protein